MSDDGPSPMPAPVQKDVAPKVIKSTRLADGVEVVEEFRISAGPLAPVAPAKNSGPAREQPMAMNTEDEWFKPANKQQSGRVPVAEAEPPPRVAARPNPSGRMAAAPSPKASGRTNAVKPSGRMPKVEVVAEPEIVDDPIPEPVEPPVADRKKTNSGRMPARAGSVSGRISARGPAAKSSKRIELPKPAPAPEPEAFEVVEEVVEEEAPKPMSKRAGAISARSSAVSRKGPAAKSSSRASKRDRDRDEDDEREERREKKKAPQGMSMPMMIGIGVAVVALLGIGIAASRKKGDTDVKKTNAPVVLDDNTPYQQYVKLAQEAERSGNISQARDYYVRGAGQAEKQGNPTYARDLNMKAMNIIKSSKRSDR